MRAFVLLLAMSLAHANDIDGRLESYVQAFNLKPLRGLPQASLEQRRLGQMLFMERLLSGNRNISCMECHHPRLNTADGLPLSLGEGATFPSGEIVRVQSEGHVLARNSHALLNVGVLDSLFWDGRVSLINGKLKTPVELPAKVRATITSALAAQALFPLVDFMEMRGQPETNDIANAATEAEAWDLLMKRLMATAHYQRAFKSAYPDVTEFNIGHVGEAIAAFQVGQFHFNDTPFDRWLKGDKSALTPVQKKGMDVFFDKGKCGNCHFGENLTNMEFVNVGVPNIGPGKQDGDDLGRFLVAPEEKTPWGFRVAPLRNIGLTAPYMHNGVYASLDEVIEHYVDVTGSLIRFEWKLDIPNYNFPLAGHDHSKDHERIAKLAQNLNLKLELTDEEKESLLQFLKHGLTDIRFK